MEEKYDMESFKDVIRKENLVEAIAVYELRGLLRYTVVVRGNEKLGEIYSDYLEYHFPRYKDTPTFPWSTKQFFSVRNVECTVKVETINFSKHPLTNIKLKLCYLFLDYIHSLGYDVTKHF